MRWSPRRGKPDKRRKSALAIATVWESVHPDGSQGVRLGGGRVRLSKPRLRRGLFVARIRGAGSVPERATLKGTLQSRDARVPSGCPLSAHVHCRGINTLTTDLHRADLRGADLRGASLHRAYGHSAALAGADLAGADLRGATLVDVDLRGSNLRRTNLADATLRHSKVRRQTLANAYLCRTTRPKGGLWNRDCADAIPRVRAPKRRRVDERAAAAAGPPERRITPRRPRFSRPRAASRRGAGRGAVATRGDGSMATLSSARKSGLPATSERPSSRVLAASACPYPAGQDADNDEIDDCDELAGWEITVTTPQALSGDGKGAERDVASDPTEKDSDGDGVIDGDEFQQSSDPNQNDTDRDGVSDEDEFVTFRSSLFHADSDGDAVSGSERDTDLFDGAEARRWRTSLRDPDTDGDGVGDYAEIVTEGTNPRIPAFRQSSSTVRLGRTHCRLTSPTRSAREARPPTRLPRRTRRAPARSRRTSSRCKPASRSAIRPMSTRRSGFPRTRCQRTRRWASRHRSRPGSSIHGPTPPAPHRSTRATRRTRPGSRPRRLPRDASRQRSPFATRARWRTRSGSHRSRRRSPTRLGRVSWRPWPSFSRCRAPRSAGPVPERTAAR